MSSQQNYNITKTIEAKNENCPLPTVKTAAAIKELNNGDIIKIIITDSASKKDLPVFVQRMGHKVLEIIEGEIETQVIIQVVKQRTA